MNVLGASKFSGSSRAKAKNLRIGVGITCNVRYRNTPEITQQMSKAEVSLSSAKNAAAWTQIVVPFLFSLDARGIAEVIGGSRGDSTQECEVWEKSTRSSRARSPTLLQDQFVVPPMNILCCSAVEVADLLGYDGFGWLHGGGGRCRNAWASDFL
ncbi:hypothetical protein BDZ45DRAFT_683463 [Acephala macrosclerotiorum]|nr:hypothetical protein BDZ45DRAFT_683463 [Acephala macrosclerotiorum]